MIRYSFPTRPSTSFSCSVKIGFLFPWTSSVLDSPIPLSGTVSFFPTRSARDLLIFCVFLNEFGVSVRTRSGQ